MSEESKTRRSKAERDARRLCRELFGECQTSGVRQGGVVAWADLYRQFWPRVEIGKGRRGRQYAAATMMIGDTWVELHADARRREDAIAMLRKACLGVLS